MSKTDFERQNTRSDSGVLRRQHSRTSTGPHRTGTSGDVFTGEERKYIEKLFQTFDTDKSNTIDFLEFKILARKLGVEMTDEELLHSIQTISSMPRCASSATMLRTESTRLDTHDCELSFEDFLDWLQSAQSQGDGGDPFSMLKVRIKAHGKKVLTNSQIEGLKECFNHFDKDKNGSIDVAELDEVFRAFGQEMEKEELTAMMAEVDDSGNDAIEFEEFLMLMINSFGEEASAEKELLEEFQKRECGRGRISVDELKELMRNLCEEQLSQAEIDDIVADLDVKDGQVEYNKWEELWEAIRE